MNKKYVLQSLVYGLLSFFLLVGSMSAVYAQKKTVSGTVLDGSNMPLPGVAIMEKGTTNGVTSDIDGKFSLSVAEDATLKLSSMGYDPQEISVAGITTINVTLKESTELIDEVVVTALGMSKSERALGYAISTIDSKELVKVGNTNFGSALYGKAAGVQIQTAPGGATGAVNINIRGLNSINGSSQPLIVVDGIPIRNGEANNDGYWGDTRIRGNGLVDLNPEDMESLSVLKGAAATALYGSEGANGVVVITTKSGKGKKEGLSVEANATYSLENVAYLPKFQNKYGPGYDRATNLSQGTDENGWYYEDLDGDGIAETSRPYYRAYAQFGPAFDGRQVIGWDNKMHPYIAQKDNFKDLFQQGHTGIYNIAVSHNTEKSNLRASLTHLNSKDVNISGPHNKTNFSINGSLKIGKRNDLSFVANNIYQHTNNRAERINRLTNSYSGFFSRFDDIAWYQDMYKTSDGYKYVIGETTPSSTPEENIKYPFRATDLLDYLWRNQEGQYDEYSNRTVVSLTDTHEFAKGLRLRARVGLDYTGMRETTKRPNIKPLSLGYSGEYSQKNSTYSTKYGDLILMYNLNLDNGIGMDFSAGATARDESTFTTSGSTRGGLTVENWYSLSASANEMKHVNATEWHKSTYGYFGTAEFSYNRWLYLNFSGRYEKFSTMPINTNSTFYHSLSSSVLLNEVLELPSWVNFSKFRVSYGEVGVPAEPYKANIVYTQGTLNDATYSYLNSGSYGNENLVPERKKEFEIGTENSFFQNRLGVELTYYNSRIVDQILNLSVPQSSGFSSMIANVGELQNYGVEIVLSGTPIRKKNFEWDVNATFSFNRNKVIALMPGINDLQHKDYDGGAAFLVSKVGRPMGDFYAFESMKDEQGRPIVDKNGYYMMDTENRVRKGNVNPDMIGGLQNNFRYKNFHLGFSLDYRIGGEILSLATHYRTSAGFFESTLQYRDKENGGLPYYINSDGNYVLSSGSNAPEGSSVYHDGLILPGVKQDGTPNDIIIDAPNYYLSVYGWGGPQYNAYSNYAKSIYENSYVKFREMSFAYDIPQQVTSSLGLESLTLSVFGRNLFYLWKTLPHSDPETTLGTQWIENAIDAGSGATSRSFGISLRAIF